jgi:hypothetical protein
LDHHDGFPYTRLFTDGIKSKADFTNNMGHYALVLLKKLHVDRLKLFIKELEPYLNNIFERKKSAAAQLETHLNLMQSLFPEIRVTKAQLESRKPS